MQNQNPLKQTTMKTMTTKINKLAAILLISAGILSSCDKLWFNDNSDVAVDSEINIRLVETFDVSPRTLQLHTSTTRQYSSGSNPIVFELCRKFPDDINVSFKGVALTGMTGDIGPARAIIDLGVLNNGTYRLNLNNGNVKRTGELIVSSDSYKVKFSNNSTFRFTNVPLNRIPEQTIWGTVGYHKQETSTLVQAFITDLMNVGAVKKSFNPGIYNEFEIDKDGNIVQPGKDSGYWFAQSFIFHYSGDIAKIEQLVKRYAHDYGIEYLYINVHTDKGERFLSWMY